MSIILSRDMSIEEIKKIFTQLPSGKKLSAEKYLGIIKLQEDPLEYQKRMRDEW